MRRRLSGRAGTNNWENVSHQRTVSSIITTVYISMVGIVLYDWSVIITVLGYCGTMGV